ncbi:MAG: phytoene desaturase family protein [Myxococcota bacterium]
MRDPDAIVIGSGPNGLVAALRLAHAGLSVLVVEANPRRPGGSLGSEEGTLPGFVHDFGAAFFPMARVSPAFRSLSLERYGVTWLNAEIESCHPALDGSSASIIRLNADVPRSQSYFGSSDDTRVWERIARVHAAEEATLFDGLLGPLPGFGFPLRIGLFRALRLASWFAASAGGLSKRWFRSSAARRVFPGLAMHADVGPFDLTGAALGYTLGMCATSVGFPIPRGGAQSLTNALVTLLELSGGQVRLGARVESIVVRGKRAAAVKLEGGEEIAARLAIVADTSPTNLLLRLVPSESLPSWVLSRVRRYRYAAGTFKLDWALGGPVPWRDSDACRAATVHVGESLEDLAAVTRAVRAGEIPEQPYLVVGQQSLFDTTRAPLGAHTLYCYTHVPSRVAPSWAAATEAFADRVEKRIEALAPGFRSLILGRRALSPEALERANENLVGGDLGGGSQHWSQQLFFRPFFPAFRYRMPLAGLYLCSSSTHPGAGAHGMCGQNAAERVLEDLDAGRLSG